MALAACLFNPHPAAILAQSSRPIRIWIDSTVMSVCSENRTFQLPVHISDIYFRDSLSGFSMSVWFDKANIELDPFIVAGQGTLAYQAKERNVTKDPQQGILYIEAGNSDLRLIAGSNQPLFYLSGRVTAPDTVTGLNGWMQVVAPVFESVTAFSPVQSDAGLIRVLRDTTEGSLRMGGASFDTLRTDTMTISLANLASHAVTECRFSLKAPGRYFRFVDTSETGTMAAEPLWKLKQMGISADSVWGVFKSVVPFAKNGPLVKLILQRNTDSAFHTSVEVSDYGVNENACLGKLSLVNLEISAESIRKDTPTIGVDRVPADKISLTVIGRGDNVLVRSEGMKIIGVQLYDLLGRALEIESAEHNNPYEMGIRLRTAPPGGMYAAVIRSDNRKAVYKQFVLIK